MLYLKNTLGGLSRSLTDSALSSFQGPHRWWKLALFAVLFVLPGGSVGVMVLAWAEHRRGRKTTGPLAGSQQRSLPGSQPGSQPTVGTEAAAHASAAPCRTRAGAACRATVGKAARQACQDFRS